MNGDDKKPEGEDDRTQFSAFPGRRDVPNDAGAQEDPDATRFVGTAPPQPQTPVDDDATRIVPTSTPLNAPSAAPQPPASHPPADDDSTKFVPTQRGGTQGQAPGEVSAAPVGAASTAAGRLASLQNPDGAAPVKETTLGGSTMVGVGTVVNNNYEITQVLKSGGMGEVYRGVEIGTGDPVAIKAILPELAEDEKAGLLFKREARTLRQLADEAIVRYYNYVHDQDLDRYFLVMEYIEGVPLSDHISTHGPIPAPAAMTLLKRLAKGLSKAHGQDVIHRDLSPDNVMLSEGDVTQARLIDFGIAKSNVVKEGTMHGQFAGKFKYVAPEQLGHYDGIIGPATDIYGLALLICAAARGKPINMGSSIVEAVQSRQNIPDLSDVPEILRPIISHMLEPDPLRRPESMEDVRRMLENPAMIPVHYREGVPLPPPVEHTGRAPLPVTSTMTNPPPGLQMPMGGTTAGFRQPVTQTYSMAPLELEPPQPKRGGGGAVGLLAMVFVAVLGGAGWFAWQSGMLGDVAETDDTTTTGETVTAGIPEPQANTRSGFLAGFDMGPCTLATRVSSGANAGMVEGYSSTGNTFDGLPVAYEEQFGARPAILPRQVTPQQCPVLEFTRALQGRERPEVVMQTFEDEIASGGTINAQIRATSEEALWPILVTPNGAAYNLTAALTESVGGVVNLGVQVTLTENTAAPHLLLLVSSDSPLTVAATAPQQGAQVAELLPLVLEEIAKRGGAANAAVGFVRVTP